MGNRSATSRQETAREQLSGTQRIDETQACPSSRHRSLVDFQIIRTIGIGGFSKVQVVQCRSCHLVAVAKIMQKTHLARLNYVGHAFREKQVLRLMNSPFIEEPISTFQDKAYLYLLLEYLPGGDLLSLLTKRMVFNLPETRFYAAEVVLGLVHLHAINCAYRDLKPENILISASGHAKLADLGLAKVLGFNEKTYTFCGTKEYLAPEQICRIGHTCEVDWWQLGILIYEMQTSDTPFSGQSPIDLFNAILYSSVFFPSSFDNATKSLISGLLDKSPDQRLKQSEVLSHPFFQDIDWKAVAELRLVPPYIPQLKGRADTQYFLQYDEEDRKTECGETGLDETFLGW